MFMGAEVPFKRATFSLAQVSFRGKTTPCALEPYWQNATGDNHLTRELKYIEDNDGKINGRKLSYE